MFATLQVYMEYDSVYTEASFWDLHISQFSMKVFLLQTNVRLERYITQ